MPRLICLALRVEAFGNKCGMLRRVNACMLWVRGAPLGPWEADDGRSSVRRNG
jgi:hypothetical protein